MSQPACRQRSRRKLDQIPNCSGDGCHVARVILDAAQPHVHALTRTKRRLGAVINAPVREWVQSMTCQNGRKADLDRTRGRRLALLTEPTTSPSLLREIGFFLAAFPAARWRLNARGYGGFRGKVQAPPFWERAALD